LIAGTFSVFWRPGSLYSQGLVESLAGFVIRLALMGCLDNVDSDGACGVMKGEWWTATGLCWGDGRVVIF